MLSLQLRSATPHEIMTAGKTSTPSEIGVQILEERLLPDCQVQVRIEVAQTFSRHQKQSAEREVAKGVTLSGFRRGHVPLPYLRENYAAEIARKWTQQLAESAIERALPLCTAAPLEENKRVEYRWEVCETETPSVLLASFECAPQLPSTLDLNALSIKVVAKPKLPPRAVDLFLKAEGERMSQIKDKEEPSQIGDIIDVAIYTRTDPPRALFVESNCPLTKERIPSWALPLVLNLRAHESREGVAESPDLPDAPACAITMQRVCGKCAPPIDDALATNLGFTGLQQWRDRVQQILQARIDSEHRAQGQQVLLEAIVKAHPFDVPKSALERQIHSSASHARSKTAMQPDEQRSEALIWVRTAAWLKFWATSQDELLSKEELDAQMHRKLRESTLSTDPKVAMRQFADLYHTTRLTSVAERVLDRYLQELGWFSESTDPIVRHSES